MKIKELRQQRADLTKKAGHILDRADAENRDLTAEETAEVTRIQADLDALGPKIAFRERQMDAERMIGRELADGLELSDEGVIEVGRDNRAYAPWGPALLASDSKETRQYKLDAHFGNQLIAIRRAVTSHGANIDPRLASQYQAAAAGASEAVGSDGGFLVGQDVSGEILGEARQTSVLYPLTSKVPISNASNSTKLKAVHETSRATGSRWGGIQGYWTAEAGSITSSKPKFREMILNLHKLAALYYSTDELEMDAPALGAIVRQAVSEEFGWLIDNALVRGTGGGLPLGVLNSGVLVSVAKETGQAAATIVFKNVTKMWTRFYARARATAQWYINQDIEAELLGLEKLIGTGGVPVYLPPGGLSQSPFGTLFGRPVIPIEQASTLGTVGDIILANFGWYVVAEKGGVQEATSIHVNFTTDETAYRFTLRLDGQPIWNSALTPANGSNTVSPFVALATRA